MSSIQSLTVIVILLSIQIFFCEDYYELLGVGKKATKKELQSAFRKLSKEYHPDKNKSNPKASEIFIKINKAYETLSDPEKRQVYDIYGEEGLSQNKFLTKKA